MSQVIDINPNKQTNRDGVWGLRTWETFGVLCFVSLLVFFIQDQVIMTKEVYYHILGEQLDVERIDALLGLQAKWKWIGYVLISAMLLVQIASIAACLFIGAILLDWKISYRSFFSLVVRAMTVIAVGKVLQTLILLLSNIQSLEDIYRADWFSLLGWLGKENIPELLLVPAGFVNVFEALFWVLLVAGVWQLSERRRGLGFVAGTYGVGMVVWCLFLVYLQVNFSS